MQTGRIVGLAVAAIAIAVPSTTNGAVPKSGAWDSGSRTSPTVAFDVRGRVGERSIRRVSVPLSCRGEHSPTGWATGGSAFGVHAEGRFRLIGNSFVVTGRFVRPGRARVVVRSDDGSCTGVRRYVVHHRPLRTPVRSGRFVALVGNGTARAFLEVSAFGRVVRVTYLEGSVDATCTDGSRRPLPLVAPEDLVLAGPIKPNGRFDVPDLRGSTLELSGSFDGGAVAALVDLSGMLPDGMRCQARGVPLVGSLAFPIRSDSTTTIPGPPAVPRIPSP
jgi:hypothetical protein